jgi:UDP-N-acetylglucosamine 2-epimerase (non-hydrolysing)
MKVMTILGTRPEIIRLSRIIPLLDKYCEHILVNTSQNFDPDLNAIFFKELGLREPDTTFSSHSPSTFRQIGKILIETEKIIRKEKPDRLVVLGDTNSALSAIVAKRLGVKVYHLEAGNRCYDDRVPEEVNRRIIDHSSDILMPYTYRSKENLLREGIESKRIFVIGNPINETLNYYSNEIEKSNILDKLKLEDGGYFLVTLHRAENVDDSSRLSTMIAMLNSIRRKYKMPIVWSIHPRTKARLTANNKKIFVDDGIITSKPFGLFDFIKLEKNATCVITDSGTVQEECCIFNIPNVTMRDVTERPETIECGSNMLTGAEISIFRNAVDLAKNSNCQWIPPPEYLVPSVSNTVGKIILGYS